MDFNSEPLEDEFHVDYEEQFKPKLELKPLPDNLRYAYLGEDETLPVILAADLTREQYDAVLSILKKHKEEIGWNLADIKGISPSIVQHRIHLMEKFTPRWDPQRRLNPVMKETVRKDILKCLDSGIIYPIFDSSWVSPIHVVPKKSGITVIHNDDNELVPTR